MRVILGVSVMSVVGAVACDDPRSSRPASAPSEQANDWGEPETPRADLPENTSESATDRGPYPMRTDEELRALITREQTEARASGKRVMLIFGATWCADCREVARVMARPELQQVLDERYRPVYVNVGRFDRHRDLIDRHNIQRIATLVILDATGNAVASSTLEPISNRQPLSTEALARWLTES